MDLSSIMVGLESSFPGYSSGWHFPGQNLTAFCLSISNGTYHIVSWITFVFIYFILMAFQGKSLPRVNKTWGEWSWKSGVGLELHPEELLGKYKLHSCSFHGSKVENMANGRRDIKSTQGICKNQSSWGNVRSQWEEANQKAHVGSSGAYSLVSSDLLPWFDSHYHFEFSF